MSGVSGEVRFEGVWFKYGDEWTLRDVDVNVPAGTRTALVGETGAGKTTLGYLAARLYDPERGGVTIDGVDLRELTFDALASAVGVVSQETYLFHASVRENLRFARPDATDEEIEEAARAAQIHDTIAALPDGYDTVVGERGFRFSGGEKQRIAIARTVLRNPPVLVLDEATLGARRPDRARRRRGAGEARRGPHDDRHRPPALDRPRRRPDRGARPRRGRRARHARGTAGAGRPLRRAGRARRRRAPNRFSFAAGSARS